MTPASIDEQLTKYLTDAHAIEEQALAQLRVAPGLAGEPELADALREHLAETEGHEQLVRARLEAHGASPSRVKDLVMKAGGLGFVLFAKSQPDTPGKLAAHAYSYEHLELASYELLMRVAQRAGDLETSEAARGIRDEEARMAQRLEGLFERTVEASLRDVGPDDLTVQLAKYMADAHAVETQSAQLLERAPNLTDDPEVQRVYAEHLEETRGHLRTLEERLAAHEAEPSRLKDAALRLGGLNWGAFFQAQPDTPGKLAAFAYAVEYLEAGAYEQLKRVAQRAGDLETAQAAERILGEEHAAAKKIAGTWDRVVDASLS